jgi:hypothetical protein
MFLTLRYEGLKARVNSKNSAKSHLYYGKEIMPKQTFIDLYLTNDSFLALFKQWQESGFLLKLTPTPVRKDSKLGYIQSNIEWVTHSENSRRGSLSAWGKV